MQYVFGAHREGCVMLTKIENPEVRTVGEFSVQYADKWFRYVIVELGEDWVYKPNAEREAVVIYIADTEEELLTIPKDERNYNGFFSGGDKCGVNINPDPGVHIGGLEIEWSVSLYKP